MAIINGTDGNDILYGISIEANTMSGGLGDDILNGGQADDFLDGGLGDDVLLGYGGSDFLVGGAGNDFLDGGTDLFSSDTMLGGEGNDTYKVFNVTDTILEFANEGTDLVLSSGNWTLGANLERLTLTGVNAANGTGNELNNRLIGNEASNLLIGGAGDDELDGSGGHDFLVGGVGNDRYYMGIGDPGDTVAENANEGTDLVLSYVSFTLGANVENLTLNGTAAINGTGNIQDNILIGNSGANVLTGGGGADTLWGEAGTDTLIGGVGDDIYVVSLGDTVVEAANEGTDKVQSDISWTLEANIEKLALTGTSTIDGTGNSLNNIFTGNSAANVFTGETGDDTYYVGLGDTVVEQAAAGTDLVYSDVTWTLGANIEKLTLTGTGAINGIGNSLNNTFIGNSAANLFTGGAGDDTYGVGAGDTVVEQANAGVDLVLSSVSFTLGANLEKLTLTGTGAIDGTGNGLANVLTGNSGANVLAGGTGDDTYGVGVGDTVVEQAAAGNDLVLSTVSWTLGANLERLSLTGTAAIDGTGNELNNTLIGNSGANVLTGLAGNDLFNGGAGADVLVGGTGDDIYYAGVGDTMVENAAEGTDQVYSDISWTLDAHIEKLALFGTAAINGTGNSGNNILTGNSAANVFTGGAGDDTYGVAVGDTVVEAANEGIDLVLSNVSFTLGANLENLTLTENAASGTGNALNNILIGNSGANVLTGGTGNDTLAGGLGSDTYRVDRGEGQDSILENDGTGGNSDVLLYGATINPLDLVLSRQVNHLRIAIHGSTDMVTIQNWFSAPTTAQVETIQAGNGQTLLSTQVDQLIQAMATFSQQTGLTWDQAIDQQPQNVQTVLAASWQ